MDVSPEVICISFIFRPSSSASICLSTVSLPCPISDAMVRRCTVPSEKALISAAAKGYWVLNQLNTPPEIKLKQPMPMPCPGLRFFLFLFQPLILATSLRDSMNLQLVTVATSPILSPLCCAFLSLRSKGSIPSSSAAMLNWVSVAKTGGGEPHPRMALHGGLLVYTCWPRKRKLG